MSLRAGPGSAKWGSSHHYYRSIDGANSLGIVSVLDGKFSDSSGAMHLFTWTLIAH